MSNFKIGEKVVCVEPSYNLIFNEIYTINFLKICECGSLSVGLLEIPYTDGYKGTYCRSCSSSLGEECLWDSKRFRKLDHQFGEDVCAEILKKVKEESLISVN